MREPGFYWVRCPSTKKEIAAWTGEVWLRCGFLKGFVDEDFAWIGPRIPEPEES